MEEIIEILKTAGCSATDPLKIRLPVLEALHEQHSVHLICEALDVPRGTSTTTFFVTSAATHGMPSGERNFALRSNEFMKIVGRFLVPKRSMRF